MTEFSPEARGAQCESCPLRGRRPITPYHPAGATLTIAMDWPRADEELHGFGSGSRARAVKKAAYSVGINQYEIGFTATTLCRPKPNMSTTDKNKALQCCKPRLVNELGAKKHIVLAGKEPLSVLWNRGNLNDWAGFTVEHENQHFYPTLAIETAFWFEPDYEQVFKLHLNKAYQRATNRLLKWTWPELVVSYSHTDQEIIDTLDKIIASPADTFCAVDVETWGDVYDDEPVFRCIGLATEHYAVSIAWPIANPYLHSALVNALRQSHLRYTYHNGLHDVPFMERFGLPARNDFDTMCAHYVLSPKIKHTLAFATAMEFNVDNWKQEFRELKSGRDGKGGVVYRDAPIEKLLVYNAKDCVASAFLARRLHDRLTVHHNGLALFEEQMFLTYTIGAKMTARGILVNADEQQKLRKLCLTNIRATRKAIRAFGLRFGFESLNVHSPKQKEQLFFEKLGCKKIKFSKKTGKASIDKKVLTKWKAHEDKDVQDIATLILTHAKWTKKYGTYVKKPDKIVHPTWRSFGAKTGRWSARGPNMQNIDKELRSMYHARPYHYLVAADYKQLEPRILAALSQEQPLLEAFARGDDVYSVYAAGIFETAEVTKELRAMAKIFVLASNYGSTPETIHEQMLTSVKGIQLEQVHFMIEKYRAAYSAIAAFKAEMYKRAAGDLYVELPLSGRRIYFYGDVKPTQVANYPIQGTAGDVVNTVIRRLFNNLTDNEHIVAQIHDDITIETTTPYETAKKLKWAMEYPITFNNQQYVFPIDIKYGTNWGRMKETGNVEELKGLKIDE